MKRNKTRCGPAVIAGTVLAVGGAHQSAHAVTFGDENFKGSFDSTISVGMGVRTRSPSPSLTSPIYDLSNGSVVRAGNLGQASGVSDQGDLNYGRGDLFTGYLKGTHELLLKVPDQNLSFMARANWIRDFAATHTTGTISGQNAISSTPPDIGSDGLSADARKDMRFKARLLDLWVSKSFSVNEHDVRVRVGNQVVNWGESVYEIGGVNATNAIDVNRAAQPGTQIKEIVLPAPMVSVAAGLGGGFNVEGYVQARWNRSYLPPVGSYWSTAIVGVGSNAYGVTTERARNGGQWGVAARYQPQGTSLNVGLYALTYHDKLPQTTLDPTTQATTFRYLEDRRLYGVSVNFPVGDWAIGSELSYRPKDAVSLNPASGCIAQGGNCYVDEKRWQWHLSTIFALQPGNGGGPLLSLLGANAASLTTEAAVIYYPNLKQDYGGSPIAAGGMLWGNEYNDLVGSFLATGAAALNSPGDAVGTKASGGINIDFNWTYDGTLIEGWQATPGIFMRRGLFGRTPNVTAQFMRGATALNFYVNFVQNPQNWQAGLNYTHFMGGRSPLDNPVRDRDFVGVVVSRNF
jgi:hypothetical protein